jgi:aspartate 1-decarboxylase
MLTKLLKAKLHRATVTETEVDYHGSIKIDSDLLRHSGILPNEAVLVVDCVNGNRFETYVIRGEPGSGTIGVYGAAALLTKIGNPVIIMSFVHAQRSELLEHESTVLICDPKNKVQEKLIHPTRL